MTQILIPTKSFEDWKALLAKPDLHWKAGRSAMTIARSWEAAVRGGGFPPEIAQLLASAQRPDWDELRLILAIPEYKVPLPGGVRPSQTDLVALLRGSKGLLAVAVEGKVDESFGPTIQQKHSEKSAGVDERLAFLCASLGLPMDCPGEIRYQLLHRTVSALLIARDFAAESAAMVVHSFDSASPPAGLEDFKSFGRLLGMDLQPGLLVPVGERMGTNLYLGWCAGDQQYRAAVAASQS